MKKKMSKALRIVTEEFQLPLSPNRYSNWHPFYLDVSGNNVPCFLEFMKLMECLQSNNTSKCHSQYDNLVKCLHKQGFDAKK